jgi:hypothetical protein
MKKKTTAKKLMLSKETITSLKEGEVINAVGGIRTQRYDHTCWTCPNTQ